MDAVRDRIRNCLLSITLCCAVAIFPTAVRAAEPAPAGQPNRSDVEYFEQHVRPLLATHCYECHSGQAKIVQGGLLLDSKPGWQKGGDSGPVIVPGKPDKSLLVRAITYADEDVQMPPKGKLSDSEIALVSEWVRRGAPDPRLVSAPVAAKRTIDMAAGRKHWAFQPLAAVKPPELADARWCRTPLDRFILDRQRQAKLSPNALADRRTLVRRASFDLLGLPPEPAEIEAFVNDPAPDAYERLVDRLLASPHFGERWARHWLDLARWAESHGFEQDYDRPYAYPYRDFVIKAFNADLAYDTFVKWQLAGDEFEPGNPLALAATGFLAAGVHATQITANQAEKERYDELDDIARTTGTAMLGLTIGCARCHDHKYDPVSNDDYYRIVATFTTTVRSHQLVNTDPAGYARQLAEFEKRRRPVAAALEQYEQGLQKKFDRWVAEKAKQPPVLPQWLVLDNLTVGSATKTDFARQDDDSYLAGHLTAQMNERYSIGAQLPPGKIFGVRIEALADDSLPAGGPGLAADGSFEIKSVKATVDGKGKKSKPADLKLTAGPQQFGHKPARTYQVATWVAKNPAGSASGSTLSLVFELGGHKALGRFRVALATSKEALGKPDPATAAAEQSANAYSASRVDSKKLSADQRRALFRQFCKTDPRWLELRAAVDASLEKKPRPTLEWMMISSENVPAVRLNTQGPDFYDKTYQVKRGDPNQKLGEATPGFLQVLLRPDEKSTKWQSQPPSGAATSYRRRALANWLTDTDGGAGSLLARVIVNRLWQHHLGRGLVGTPSDFGIAGEKPTHPELLEYLARELVRGGWRLKPIHKLMMTSAVYMQTADVDAARLAADRDNGLWWHREPQRLEAEALRDAMLAVSGKLDPAMFGPGTLEADQNRRSIYFFVKRSQLVPMMMLFDSPDTLQDLPARTETTIAPQALLLLNSTLVRQYADALAARVIPAENDAARAAVAKAYALVIGREPTTAEARAAADFLTAQAAAYRSEQREKPEQLAWGDFCQVLLGTNEFVYVR